MDQPFGERLERLRKVHHLLREEAERLARSGPLEAEALQRVHDRTRSGRERAHSLLVSMAYEDAPEALQHEAEDLQLSARPLASSRRCSTRTSG